MCFSAEGWSLYDNYVHEYGAGIDIKPEHVDGWLNPDPNDLEALFAIMDDKRHPYYEHRMAA